MTASIIFVLTDLERGNLKMFSNITGRALAKTIT